MANLYWDDVRSVLSYKDLRGDDAGLIVSQGYGDNESVHFLFYNVEEHAVDIEAAIGWLDAEARKILALKDLAVSHAIK